MSSTGAAATSSGYFIGHLLIPWIRPATKRCTIKQRQGRLSSLEPDMGKGPLGGGGSGVIQLNWPESVMMMGRRSLVLYGFRYVMCFRRQAMDVCASVRYDVW